MKIAIPTHDGIHITDEIIAAKGFHVFTVESGEISDDELRWRDPNDAIFPEKSPLQLIKDCSAILVSLVPGVPCPQTGGFQYIPVNEKIITKIIWRYISEMARQEANTCCCP
jgi:hypothetical protein